MSKDLGLRLVALQHACEINENDDFERVLKSAKAFFEWLKE